MSSSHFQKKPLKQHLFDIRTSLRAHKIAKLPLRFRCRRHLIIVVGLGSFDGLRLRFSYQILRKLFDACLRACYDIAELKSAKSERRKFMKVKLVILFALIWSACSLPTTPSSNERQSTESKQSAQTSSKQGAGQCQNAYLPVVQGASWKYENKTESGDSSVQTETITRVRENGFDTKMDFGSGVTVERSWECRNDGLVHLDANKNITGSLKGIQVEGKVESVSGVTIPADLKPGQTWDQKIVYVGTGTSSAKKLTNRGTLSSSCRAVGFEQVQVPAGTFEALKVECSMKYEMNIELDKRFTNPVPTSFDSQDTHWMVAGVGIVKSKSKTDIYNSEMNLLSYNIP